MPQYLVVAKDDTDENALARRMDARPSHFEQAKRLKVNGNFIVGGATLDENGQMNGSMMVVEFENEVELQNWLAIEPYLQKGVWKSIEIKPFQVANL